MADKWAETRCLFGFNMADDMGGNEYSANSDHFMLVNAIRRRQQVLHLCFLLLLLISIATNPQNFHRFQRQRISYKSTSYTLNIYM